MKGVMMTERELSDWLNQHPNVRKLFVELVLAIENKTGSLDKVDDIEEFLFQELQQ